MILVQAARRPLLILSAIALFTAITVGGVLALGPDQPVSSDGPAPSRAPERTSPATVGSAWGVILDPSGRPVANASIAIAAIDRDVPIPEIAVVSGVDGRYRTITLPEGRYELTIGASGFRPAFVEVTIVAGQMVEAPEAALEPEAIDSEVESET